MCASADPASAPRRAFLRLAVVGAGGLAVRSWPTARLEAAGQADVLLLTCMDYRLLESVSRYMRSRGLRGKYDHVILAGAALGAVTDKFAAWGQTFWQHLDTAIELHGIHKVIVIDHRDCGAYKVILGEDLSSDPAKERSVHAVQLRKLRDDIKARHAALDVELGLMDLRGKVQTIG